MIIDHLYLLHQLGVQPGQHRWVQIKLCQIGFPSLLVGLVCFEQEVRIDSPSTPQVHIIIGSSPYTSSVLSTLSSLSLSMPSSMSSATSSVSTLSSLPSPTHFNIKAGLSTSVKLSKADQRRLQVVMIRMKVTMNIAVREIARDLRVSCHMVKYCS